MSAVAGVVIRATSVHVASRRSAASIRSDQRLENPVPNRIPAPGSVLEEESLRFIRDLIRIESVNTGDPDTIGDGEARAARYVQAALEEAGYETTYLESHPGRGSVVARLAGADPDRGALVVHAHLDVVPVDGQEWTHPPFGAEIHDGHPLRARRRGHEELRRGDPRRRARVHARRHVVPAATSCSRSSPTRRPGESGVPAGSSSITPSCSPGRPRRSARSAGSPCRSRRVAARISWRRPRRGSRGRASALAAAPGHGSRPTADNAVVRLARAVAAVGEHRFPVTRTPALEAFLASFGAATGCRVHGCRARGAAR